MKDIEKFYELNQQLSMDDLARSISFTLKSGQFKYSHFQKKINTHKGLSGESGGKSSQKFGATQRGKVWYINLEFLKEVSAPENSRSGIQSLLKPSLLYSENVT